jgi:peptidoglycan hydrolase CwlO-like protein
MKDAFGRERMPLLKPEPTIEAKYHGLEKEVYRLAKEVKELQLENIRLNAEMLKIKGDIEALIEGDESENDNFYTIGNA